MNPYFKKTIIKPPVPPIIQQIKSQLAKGCAAPNNSTRPLADNFVLRHKQNLPVTSAFKQTAASIVVGDLPFAQAHIWMKPYLNSKNLNETKMAHLLLASHAARKLAEGNTVNISELVISANNLATKTGLNLSDIQFAQALRALNAKNYDTAIQHITSAIKSDPIFYNGHLLKLEIELKQFSNQSTRLNRKCVDALSSIMQTTVNLGGLDTCPRHAVLMEEWVRSKFANPDAQLSVQIVSAYIALFTNKPARMSQLADRLEILRFRYPKNCLRFVYHRIKQLEKLQ